MNIGLVGEAPNDTKSIKVLLQKKYSEGFEFVFMLDRINGSQLDSQKTKRFLRIEYEFKKPDIVIFIRDLDSILPNKIQMSKKKLYFSEFNSVVDKKGIYLLNIYEIEALILADIEAFNDIYHATLATISKPMEIEEPKEYLKSREKKYNESENPKIFENLRFEIVIRLEYFKLFIAKLDKKISDLKL
jgi:hypothetical protein